MPRFRVSLTRLLVATLLGLFALALPLRVSAAPAKKIYAGVYLRDVTRFDQKDGVFDVDLELWAKWLGDFNHDNLTIANAGDTNFNLVSEESDGAWHSARWRVRGTLRGEFPLQRFPFDRQTLSIALELPATMGDLQPDLAGSGVRERFSVTGWLYDPVFVPRTTHDTYRSDWGSIAHEGKPTKVQRVMFDVTLRRPLLMATTKLFLPLMVILLVAMIALMIHPRWLDVRAGVGVTALLACFAFQFSVADTMPNVSYITTADLLFLAAYGITALLLLVSVVASYLHDKEREKLWRRLDVGALLSTPLAIALILGLAAHEPSRAHATTVAPVRGARPPSARDVVRIGVNTLETAAGGLAGRGTNWGTLREELDGTNVPVLVEEAPSITNESLRFLADGKLDVTWRLRAGLKWSDAQPLSAEDLAFALKVSPDPYVVDVRVASPRELVVRYRDRVAAALESITPLPRHVLQSVFDKGGYDAVRDYRRTHILPSSGPYKVTEFKPNELCVLEANPHFVGPKPSIRRIELKRYASDEALVAAFNDKQVDLIAPNALAPEVAEGLAKVRPDAVKIRPSDVLYFLHADLEVPELTSLEARRALLMAFDRDRLRRDTFGDMARVAHVPVPGALPEGAQVLRYDPDAARKALSALGLTGHKIRLSHAARAVDRDVVQQLVRDAAAVGITLEPVEVEKLTDLYRKRKHGGLLLTSTTGERDAAPEKYWGIPQVGGQFDPKFRSEAYDDAIADLVSREEHALYPERRDQIRNLLFVDFSKRLPNLPLVFLADSIVAVPELDGFEEGSGVNFGTTLERWHFAATR
ncbi:MAG: ABC transporter substrate-binding protein [Polyangiaceae bacterium]